MKLTCLPNIVPLQTDSLIQIDMTRFLSLVFFLFITFQSFAQTSDLSQYSFVVIPNQFDFQNASDQYQLNSMTKFYLDKNGFNSFLAGDIPNADRCDGLFADVEELKAVFGTKLQIVLKDCNKNEIYRGPEGKSKFKEFEKSYQDALRKAFEGLDMLKVKQKDVVLLNEKSTTIPEINKEFKQLETRISSDNSGLHLPSENYSNYSSGGNSFILRKIGEGYSLYSESDISGDDLVLLGKIIVLDTLVKFMDASGQVKDAAFEVDGTLKIGSASSAIVYKKVKN